LRPGLTGFGTLSRQAQAGGMPCQSALFPLEAPGLAPGAGWSVGTTALSCAARLEDGLPRAPGRSPSEPKPGWRSSREASRQAQAFPTRSRRAQARGMTHQPAPLQPPGLRPGLTGFGTLSRQAQAGGMPCQSALFPLEAPELAPGAGWSVGTTALPCAARLEDGLPRAPGRSPSEPKPGWRGSREASRQAQAGGMPCQSALSPLEAPRACARGWVVCCELPRHPAAPGASCYQRPTGATGRRATSGSGPFASENPVIDQPSGRFCRPVAPVPR
jgi:hypothetical protein